jgi:heptosyltransferase II
LQETIFNDMKNVAILMPHWIGEFVLALSVVSRKAQEERENITLIVPQHLIPLCTLFTPLPYFPYRRNSRSELLQSISGVKRQNFDKLYILTNSLSTSWFGLRTGIPQRRGISSELMSPFLTQALLPTPEESSEHLTRDYAEILEVPYINPEEWPGVTIPAQEDFSNTVALCPGSNHGWAKQWPGFREIIKLLPSYQFVVLGDKNDTDVAKSVASHFPHRVRNMTGQTTIEAAAVILASVSVAISNHSGLMHLAGFMGTPVVGVFGSTSMVRHRPLGESVRCAAAASTPCSGCNKGTCSRKDYICMNSVSPGTVMELAGEIVRQPA